MTSIDPRITAAAAAGQTLSWPAAQYWFGGGPAGAAVRWSGAPDWAVHAAAVGAAWAQTRLGGGSRMVAVVTQPDAACGLLASQLAALPLEVIAGAPVAPVQGSAPTAGIPPVHLPALPVGGAQPWPCAGGAALAALDQALAWLAEREARVVPVADAPWSAAPAAAAVALAEAAAWGLRPVWRVGSASVLADAAPGLALAGARGLPLTICAPWSAFSTSVADAVGRWWVAGATDAREAGAQLTWTLAHDQPGLLLAAPPDATLPPTASDWVQEHGAGRILAGGRDGVLVADAAHLGAAWAERIRAVGAGVDLGVVHATSLCPAPEGAWRSAPRAWAMIDPAVRHLPGWADLPPR